MKNFHIFLLLFCAFLGSHQITAQVDAHYWTHQYGSKGLLLNGAVIASADGETAMFYNPGSIGMSDNLGFTFSYATPTYSQLQTTNLLGDGNSIKDTDIGLAPGFLGVRFRPFSSDKITAGVSTFTRYKTDIAFRDRVSGQVNDNSDYLYSADINFRRRIKEDWVGFGLAYSFSENFGIGLSQFSIWHSQSNNFDLNKAIVYNNSPTNIVQSYDYAFDYNFSLNSGFITKLGWSYRNENFNLGLTYTSPMYGITHQSADYSLDEKIINRLDQEYDFISNRNRPIVAYKSPASIGAGLDIIEQDLTISFAAEYFNQIKSYKIIDDLDDGFRDSSPTPTPIAFIVESENEAVFNMAVGVQKIVSEKTTLIFGVRTDFNQNNKLRVNDNPEYLGSVGDVFHISGGTALNLEANRFSCGFDFGFGRKTGGRQVADLSNFSPNSIFKLSDKENVDSQFYSFMLFMTYDFIYKSMSGH